MKLWSKVVSAVLAVASLSVGQTVPASSLAPLPAAPASASSAPSVAVPVPVPPSEPTSAPGTAPPANSASCSGAAWLCVSQALQRLMFNPDGTHRPDADIAAGAPGVIAGLIKDGVMKPQDAPKSPITGFDDANKYADSYPTGESETAAPAPAANTPPTPAPCSPDRPWLCESSVSTAPPASANGQAKPTGAPKSGTAKASGKSNGAKQAATTSAPQANPNGVAIPLYVLGPNDVVGITVFDEKTIPGTYAIGPDGRMSVPLLGNFTAIGLTIPQLTTLITDKCRDMAGILDPIVNVQLLRSNSKQFTLLGGFGRSGPVPLLRETTILDAVAAAGVKDFAKTKKIVLRRGTQTFPFNYDQVLKGLHMEQNITIQDGDIIYLPE